MGKVSTYVLMLAQVMTTTEFSAVVRGNRLKDRCSLSTIPVEKIGEDGIDSFSGRRRQAAHNLLACASFRKRQERLIFRAFAPYRSISQ